MNRLWCATVAAALLVACGPSMSDELAPPAATDTGCHSLPEAVHARYPEVVQTLSLEMQEKTRTLTIGIDSANRVRVLNASAHLKRGTNLTVRAANVLFDAEGRMTEASRTVTAGDVESKGTRSNADPLSPADTARARALAVTALQRCVK